MVDISVSQALGAINWDFGDAPPNTGIHAIHPYPAKFIPQIPATLIELLDPDRQALILDPFCGSGTTLVEAIRLGRNVWGIDLHPLACLISRVKTTPLPHRLGMMATTIIQVAKSSLGAKAVKIPPIPRLDHWFKPEVQAALAALVAEIEQEPDIAIKEALQVALSSIIVRVSNQESDTRYAAIEKPVSARYVFEQFHHATAGLDETLSRFYGGELFKDFQPFGKATVLNRNILKVMPDELPDNIGLVITSPPYPNAYEYWLYHKYRMYWLGMDPIAVREQEIGARAHYFKTNHPDESDFEQQMGICFELLSKVMRPQAKACFLVGRSIIHGRTIDNVALLQRAAHPWGFEPIGVVERRIPANRKAFSHGNILQEHLIVFNLGHKP